MAKGKGYTECRKQSVAVVRLPIGWIRHTEDSLSWNNGREGSLFFFRPTTKGRTVTRREAAKVLMRVGFSGNRQTDGGEYIWMHLPSALPLMWMTQRVPVIFITTSSSSPVANTAIRLRQQNSSLAEDSCRSIIRGCSQADDYVR